MTRGIPRGCPHGVGVSSWCRGYTFDKIAKNSNMCNVIAPTPLLNDTVVNTPVIAILCLIGGVTLVLRVVPKKHSVA